MKAKKLRKLFAKSNHKIRDFYKSFKKEIKRAGFEYFGSGSFRFVYCRGNVVIKIPRNRTGLIDNFIEAKAYKKYKKNSSKEGFVFAPCRLLKNNALMMVKVDTNFGRSAGPTWVFNIDGSQAGIWKGRIVAYDFAMNVSERKAWEDNLKIKSWYQKSHFFHA